MNPTDIERPPVRSGQMVRSFDFPEHNTEVEGDNACFVEGTVLGIVELNKSFSWMSGDQKLTYTSRDCQRVCIAATRRVARGKEIEHADFYFPPQNGLENWMGGKTNGIAIIEYIEYN